MKGWGLEGNCRREIGKGGGGTGITLCSKQDECINDRPEHINDDGDDDGKVTLYWRIFDPLSRRQNHISILFLPPLKYHCFAKCHLNAFWPCREAKLPRSQFCNLALQTIYSELNQRTSTLSGEDMLSAGIAVPLIVLVNRCADN